jgi:hypothetical protein
MIREVPRRVRVYVAHVCSITSSLSPAYWSSTLRTAVVSRGLRLKQETVHTGLASPGTASDRLIWAMGCNNRTFSIFTLLGFGLVIQYLAGRKKSSLRYVLHLLQPQLNAGFRRRRGRPAYLRCSHIQNTHTHTPVTRWHGENGAAAPGTQRGGGNKAMYYPGPTNI